MVTEHTHTSWFSRMATSLGGVVFGIVLIALAVGVLWWNEGRSVKRAKGLAEGAASVSSVGDARIAPEMSGRLVHVSGKAIPGAGIVDPLTDFTFDGLALQREVEMFQWVEQKDTQTKKNLGGSEERVTTYTYDRSWESREVSSESFKEPSAHTNPPMPFRSDEFYSEGSTLGAFDIGERVLRALPKEKIFDLGSVDSDTLAGRGAQFRDGLIYVGDDPDQAEIGDLRLRYAGSGPQEISVVAKQSGDAFEAYPTESGSSIFLVQPGRISAENMFVTAEKTNAALTWILRGVGLVVLFVGFASVLRPISVFADVVPFFGSVASAGISVVSFLLACMVGFATVALAWIFFRPLIGIVLLIVVGGAAFGLVSQLRSGKATAESVGS